MVSTYRVQVNSRSLRSGVVKVTVFNHPEFSYRKQDLQVAFKLPSAEFIPNDIDTYRWLTADEWAMTDGQLEERLQEVL